MKIAIIGSGYVGLVAGTCFAELGHHIVCVDNDAKKVTALKNGMIPIYEPGLEDMVKANSAAGRLEFTENLKDALKGAQATVDLTQEFSAHFPAQFSAQNNRLCREWENSIIRGLLSIIANRMLISQAFKLLSCWRNADLSQVFLPTAKSFAKGPLILSVVL